MPVSRHHYTNVLKFWRAVETFTLPDIPLPNKYDNKLYNKLEPGRSLPWEPGNIPAPRENKQWRHTLYFHVVTKEGVVDLLARLSQSKEYREAVNGQTCLSGLVLNQLGQALKRTYAPAAFAYGIKILREKGNPEELEELLRKAEEDCKPRFWEKEEPDESEGTSSSQVNIVDWKVLQKELDLVRGLVRNGLKVETSVLCISAEVDPAVHPEAPFLNSYYMNDLNTLINHPDELGRPLELLLTEQADLSVRYNLLNQRALLASLHPKDLSPGRWPSSPALGLYSAQQAALNISLGGWREKSGLLGVNGPPGTGKTTLLREILCDVVVRRAQRLLKTNVKELFAAKRTVIVDRLGYYEPDTAVFINDGIVVASNNNTAVENISKELPVLKSIDREAFEGEYFSGIATNIQGEPCWGLLSAVLGKSENRNAFINKFWFNKGNGFSKFLREQYEDVLVCKQNLENYEETAKDLKALLEEYEVFHVLAGEYHDLLLKGGASERLRVLATQLQKEYGVTPDDLPGLSFLDQPLEKIHAMRPYSSERINRLRSTIFLRSLELQEWAIRVNARPFYSNLNAFVDLVSNKYSTVIREETAMVLWRSLFFCIPLVSVTLASFQRQFSKMGRGSIGWLLLDEAGQATLPSVCGALWRSERALIIGDTLQIPPVVTLPAGLGKLLQNTYAIQHDCWSPLQHSAQFLADRVTAPGTYINPGQLQSWTGIPLRAHRRCSEPMFSISNAIAYNGQMVKVTQDVSRDIPTGPSGWIDVQGMTSPGGHAITEELLVLSELLQQLSSYEGKVYVISPFRSVGDICKKEFNLKGRVECGTIHTFQGKEAEVVFLVLGTQIGSVAARNWVAGSPNILNVAVTRAKERLYVIGNKKAWEKHKYFDLLAEKMPVKEHYSGRLF